jgi:hypothetical protein
MSKKRDKGRLGEAICGRIGQREIAFRSGMERVPNLAAVVKGFTNNPGTTAIVLLLPLASGNRLKVFMNKAQAERLFADLSRSLSDGPEPYARKEVIT